jgi:ribosomal protein L37AE/L43A
MTRDEAIDLLAREDVARLTPEERAEELRSMTHMNWDGVAIDAVVRDESEEGELAAPPSDPRYDAPLVFVLRGRYAAATNRYLAGRADVDAAAITGEPARREACPCCGRRTIHERSGYDICTVCRWEDDGQDNKNADVVMGGPNYKESLTQARVNFLRHGIAHPDRRDLRAIADSPEMYAPGRVFVLEGDAVREEGARWESREFE